MRPAIAVLLCALSFVSNATAEFVIPDELKGIIEDAHEACKQETGVSHDVLIRACEEKVLVDDPKLKCYLKCMMQRLQAMKDDGSLDLELIQATLPAQLLEQGAMDSLQKCLPTPGADLCQAAFDVLKCVNKVNPDLLKMFE